MKWKHIELSEFRNERWYLVIDGKVSTYTMVSADRLQERYRAVNRWYDTLEEAQAAVITQAVTKKFN